MLSQLMSAPGSNLSPNNALSNVVLPDPEGPQSAICSPAQNARLSMARTDRSTPLLALTEKRIDLARSEAPLNVAINMNQETLVLRFAIRPERRSHRSILAS